MDSSKIKNKGVRALSLLIVLFLATGCATMTPRSLYPKFFEQKTKISKVEILCDFLLAEDISGNVDMIHVPRSIEKGNMLLGAFSQSFQSKDYQVTRKEIVSMGLGMGLSTQVYKVAQTNSDKKKEDLLETALPAYVNETFVSTPEKRAALEVTLTRLRLYTKISSSSIVEIPEIVALADPNVDALLMVVMNGRRIPMGKTLGQAFLSATLTMGLVAAAQTSSLQMGMYLLDSKTGEIIWSDNYAVGDGSVISGHYSGSSGEAASFKDKVLKKVAAKMVSKIPGRLEEIDSKVIRKNRTGG